MNCQGKKKKQGAERVTSAGQSISLTETERKARLSAIGSVVEMEASLKKSEKSIKPSSSMAPKLVVHSDSQGMATRAECTDLW